MACRFLNADDPEQADVKKLCAQLSGIYVRSYTFDQDFAYPLSDVEGVRNLVGTGLVEFIGGIFTAVLAFFFLIRISPSMTAIALVVMSVFGFMIRKAFRQIRPMFRDCCTRPSRQTSSSAPGM